MIINHIRTDSYTKIKLIHGHLFFTGPPCEQLIIPLASDSLWGILSMSWLLISLGSTSPAPLVSDILYIRIWRGA